MTEGGKAMAADNRVKGAGTEGLRAVVQVGSGKYRFESTVKAIAMPE